MPNKTQGVYLYPVQNKKVQRLSWDIDSALAAGDVLKADAPIGLINGILPDSKEEWWTYLELIHFQLTFLYQYAIYGGTTVRGGQKVDFVVFAPDPRPLQIFGNYWHPGELNDEEQLNLAAIRQYFGRDADILWANDLVDRITTRRAIRDLYVT